jgi:hypothetical protein
VFDGRYLVLPPSSNDGAFLRFDTSGSFVDPAAWSVYSDPSFVGQAHLFSGAVFDGTQTYFAPQNAGAVVRHVADASFDAGWSALPVTGKYSGAILDPKHITFAPNGGVAAQLDLSGPWAAGSAWSTFFMGSLDAGPDTGLDAGTDAGLLSYVGYFGGTFDGRYAYFAPGFFQGVGFGNVVVRVDTLAPFTDAGSWATFDMTSLDAGPRSCAGAVFDGHYVYFVPLKDATVVRFEARSAWAPPPAGNKFSFF